MSCFLISRTVFLYCSLRKPTIGPPAFPLNMQFSSTQHSISLLMSFLIREEENLVTLLMFNLCQNCRPGCGADFCKKLIVHCRNTEKFLTRRLQFKKKNKTASINFFFSKTLQPSSILCLETGCCQWRRMGVGSSLTDENPRGSMKICTGCCPMGVRG